MGSPACGTMLSPEGANRGRLEHVGPRLGREGSGRGGEYRGHDGHGVAVGWPSQPTSRPRTTAVVARLALARRSVASHCAVWAPAMTGGQHTRLHRDHWYLGKRRCDAPRAGGGRLARRCRVARSGAGPWILRGSRACVHFASFVACRCGAGVATTPPRSV